MYNVSEKYKSAIARQTRLFTIGGDIKLQDGSKITIDDTNTKGEIRIESQMMSGTSYDNSIDIGACCSAELTMTVIDDSEAASFADAKVRLWVNLTLEDETPELVKMGVFYVNNASIERVKNQITFTAYDKMIFLHYLLTDEMREKMSGMTPYKACEYLCGLAGIGMAQSSTAVSVFPNAGLALDYYSAAIETARDVVMWCGQMMGCFTRITRGGLLEFVQIKAENDTKTGMIIPVREIAANQRISTKFADGVLRITTLTMANAAGKPARAYLKKTSATKRSLELELEQNPLLIGQSTKPLAQALKDILSVLKTAYFRPFSSEIANDPALDAGDYVRLRGGSIDTSRGYATGIITHNVWRYRGHQEIVNVGDVPVISQLDDSAEAAVTALSDSEDGEDIEDEIAGEEMVFAQPKPQSGKMQRGKSCSGISGTPITSHEILSDTSVKVNDTTYIIEKNAEGLISKITDSNGNELKPKITGEITDIALHNAALWGAVMARGIGKSGGLGLVMPDMSGITGYFIPERADVKNNVWKNSVSGSDIALTNVTKSGSVLEFTQNSYGVHYTDEPNTVYCIVRLKAALPSNQWSQIISKSVNVGMDRSEFNLTANYNNMFVATAGNDCVLTGKNTEFGIYAYTRDIDNVVKCYFNGDYIGTPPKSTIRGNYTGKMMLNTMSRGGAAPDPSTNAEFIMCAFGTEYHTPEQAIRNCRWLLEKMNKDWRN